MSTKFHHNIRRDGDVTWVSLGGVIDEDNELAALGDQIDGPIVVIDVAGVERINSCGVRDWVNWLGGIKGRQARVVLVRCSPAIVAQINLVNNFAAGGVVKSFYIPYFCPECDQEKVLLTEASELGPPPHQPPVCRCDECDLVMEFDDMADSYFAFLAHQPAGGLGDLAEVIEQAAAGAEPERIRTRAPSVPAASASAVSLPSIPSLPTGSQISSPGERRPPPSNPPSAEPAPLSAPARPKPDAMFWALIAVIAAAVAGLIYLLTT